MCFSIGTTILFHSIPAMRGRPTSDHNPAKVCTRYGPVLVAVFLQSEVMGSTSADQNMLSSIQRFVMADERSVSG